jgi:hypothetical protein
VAFAGTREREEASAVGASIVGGSGGILPRKIFEPRVSQMPFPGLWGKILRNSDGQKKYDGQKTLVKQDAFVCGLGKFNLVSEFLKLCPVSQTEYSKKSSQYSKK